MAAISNAETSHPASWAGEPIPLRDCDFEALHHPASVRVVEKDEKKALDLKSKGNEQYSAKKYLEAYESYTEALEYAPLSKDFERQRAILFSNRAACLAELGRHEEVIEDCTRALDLDSTYVKALLRRMKAYEARDELDECLKDMDAVLALEPQQPKLRRERDIMEQRVKEKHEKLKEEMMGKLKEAGNWILGKFGLSTENFQMVQDPSTGSYSINFKQ
jgi:tetratricopeptide (TPR) repeat protein